MSSTSIPKVLPAQLSFLAIYNPSLGTSDETVDDQIVFYHAQAAKGSSSGTSQDWREQRNEKLRQVGLAQGMVGFARGFSNGQAVNSVETEKSRIVLHELEAGWWILASVSLTQLPAASTASPEAGAGSSSLPAPAIEFSSREVSPPALLLCQLLRAHSVFLLHHGTTLEALFAKLGRTKFCNALHRFWSTFASRWDVLLHGSPAVEIFRSLKLAAGGELGMGVGEEEWGSGEREVLEDFAGRTDGLVDLMVSRFGEPSPLQAPNAKAAASPKERGAAELDPWIGRGSHVNAGDGVVFSGTGALSRPSLRVLSHWVEDIYALGDQAYGVKENPTADQRRRRRRDPKPVGPRREADETPVPTAPPPGIPPPIVKAAQSSLDRASEAVDATKKNGPSKAPLGDSEAWMRYLTLGYGSAWGSKQPQNEESKPLPNAEGERAQAPEMSLRHINPEPEIDRAEIRLRRQTQQENSGYFIIGLKGDLEDDDFDDENQDGDWNNRIPLRTVHVELVKSPTGAHDGNDKDDGDERAAHEGDHNSQPATTKLARVWPVVYVHRPFIYTFLFHPRTESLTLATFYRNLHAYLSPLHRPLNSSTSPGRVDARVSAASHPYTTISSTTGSGPNTQPIYDLVHDPRTLTVHASLPNIPEPGTLVAEGLSSTGVLSGWSRVEALNVHSQILATVASTRETVSDLERTCKTSRGWWVVWMRLPPSSAGTSTEVESQAQADAGFSVADLREAFLVRRAHDGVASSTTSKSSGVGRWRLGGPSTGEKTGGAGAGWGPRGLAEGIGIDARRYVEGLLSLNR